MVDDDLMRGMSHAGKCPGHISDPDLIMDLVTNAAECAYGAWLFDFSQLPNSSLVALGG